MTFNSKQIVVFYGILLFILTTFLFISIPSIFSGMLIFWLAKNVGLFRLRRTDRRGNRF